jgi:hypothetical protein
MDCLHTFTFPSEKKKASERNQLKEVNVVGFSSRLVASLRAQESARPNPLFVDPYADLLCGEARVAHTHFVTRKYSKELKSLSDDRKAQMEVCLSSASSPCLLSCSFFFSLSFLSPLNLFASLER